MFASIPTTARRSLALAALAIFGVAVTARAQTAANWPTKPIRVVVGFAPGGSTDVMARMNRELGKALAQQTVKARYADLGAESIAMETAEFRKLLANETAQLSGLIKQQKIVVD